jgi:NAD(P)H-dependent FMN reductase
MQAADRRPEPTSVLAISGSLRRGSVNSAALIDESSRRLPHFDPDLELDPPAAVRRFRATCELAPALLFCVPEYAFGIPGAFKNALDWTVGSGALNRKPVTVLSVAAVGRGGHVRQALDLVLRALGADVVHRSVPVAASDRDGDGEIAAPRILQHLRTVAAELTARAGAPPSA